MHTTQYPNHIHTQHFQTWTSFYYKKQSQNYGQGPKQQL